MTPDQLVSNTKAAVIAVGAAFGHDAAFRARAARLGLTPRQYYFAGRCGVLGEVPAAVVAAACGFFAPDLVSEAWETARRVVPLDQAVRSDMDQCVMWSRTHLGGMKRLDRLADLSEHAVAGADAAARPLFAAWRAVAGPADDAAARVALALLRLREHRGASHVIAVAAVGLTPLTAILAGPGERKADANGWRPPYPEVAPDSTARRAEAEVLTDRLAAQAFTVLSASERAELAALLDTAYTRWRRLPRQ